MPSRRRGRRLLIVVLGALALVVAACGGRDDFENDPRPPVPLEVNVAIQEGGVSVSPSNFGAGLVNFTIANLTNSRARLEIAGPTAVESPEIAPRNNTIIKAQMDEGGYTFSVGGTSPPALVEVGPERESGKDELLLP